MAQLTNPHFSSDDLLFCQQSLVKVSRTFALNIRVLNGNLAKSILLCYLLCRIIDTIEDCPDQSAGWKTALLNEFPSFLEKQDDDGLRDWIFRALQGAARPAEKELLQESARVLRGYWSLPEELRLSNKFWVTQMSRGMSKYVDLFAQGPQSILEDKAQLEDYCYYVAGTVGKCLTASFAEFYHFPEKLTKELDLNSVSFGLGLQLTNIAKDLIEDRNRGWTYLPLSYLTRQGLSLEDFMQLKPEHLAAVERAYLDLLDDALIHLKQALDYTLALPVSHLRVRLFCLRPLWMAIETLLILKDRHREVMRGKTIKISRQQVKQIMTKTFLLSPFNEGLRKDFEAKLKLYENLSPIS